MLTPELNKLRKFWNITTKRS